MYANSNYHFNDYKIYAYSKATKTRNKTATKTRNKKKYSANFLRGSKSQILTAQNKAN